MDDFTAALKGYPHERVPVWFMRQAGRYSESYRKVRKTRNIKEICMDPATSVDVTAAPVKDLGVDAAILFFDILLPAEGMGFSVNFDEGKGPVIGNPFLSQDQRKDISGFQRDMMPYPLEKTVNLFRERMPQTPLIGFSGGPITMLSYLLAGKADRDLLNTRKFLLNNEKSADDILSELTETIIQVLKIQINSGCRAVQVFDSWAGFLPPSMLEWYCSRYITQIAAEIEGSVPSIYFSTQSSANSEILDNSGFDFLSLDWRCRLADVALSLHPERGLQGNLDPAIAAYDAQRSVLEAERIAASMKGRSRYIFNLGHGVLPETPAGNLKRIVECVHELVIQ